jgi:TatD DNase family protein
MLTDTHAHLFWEDFKEDFDQVINKCLDAGVNQIVNVGVDVALSKTATELSANNPQMTFYSSVAIHPEEAIKYIALDAESKIQSDMQALEEIYLSNPEKVIAIGECGLDYAYFIREGYLPEGVSIDQAQDLQEKLFIAQINLAKKLKLPLLIHVRDDRSKNPDNTECWDRAIDLSKDHFGVYHCYSGKENTTKRILTETNFLFSFAGNITYKNNDYLREALRVVPLERIVLETDCPFLPPQSIRGQRNDPSSVKEIAQLVADLKETSFQEVAAQTTQNFKGLLALSRH